MALQWLLWWMLGTAAADPDTRSARLYLSDNLLVTATEGPGEPRSIGSYALRLYRVQSRQTPMDDYSGGLVRPRDGGLEQLLATDTQDDGYGCAGLVVVIRSAGSGGYLQADYYLVGDGKPQLQRSLDGLPADADVLGLLGASPCMAESAAP